MTFSEVEFQRIIEACSTDEPSPEHRLTRLSKRALVAHLYPRIIGHRRSGYSLEGICEWLRNHGAPMSAGTLQKYLQLAAANARSDTSRDTTAKAKASGGRSARSKSAGPLAAEKTERTARRRREEASERPAAAQVEEPISGSNTAPENAEMQTAETTEAPAPLQAREFAPATAALDGEETVKSSANVATPRQHPGRLHVVEAEADEASNGSQKKATPPATTQSATTLEHVVPFRTDTAQLPSERHRLSSTHPNAAVVAPRKGTFAIPAEIPEDET